MKSSKSSVRFVRWGVAVFALMLVGCEAGFVREAARTNIASFLTSLVTTVVDETVGPE